MPTTLDKYFELKSKILNEILNTGHYGIPESSIYRCLHNEGKQNDVFDYKEGFTPDELVDSLIVDGDVIKISLTEFSECRFIASERYLW